MSSNSTTKSALKKTGKQKTNKSKNASDKSPNKHAQDQPSTSGLIASSPSKYCVPLSALNPFITCSLCDGYYIDAVTTMECLHTFCKSCLLKYFEADNVDCPKCHLTLHQSHPTQYVVFDRTVQEIVYKLVPGLQSEEQRRRMEFIEERGRLGLPMGDESESDDEDRRAKRAKKLKKLAQQRNGNLRNGVCSAKSTNHVNGDDAPPSDLNGENKQCCTETTAFQAHHRNDEATIIHLVPADNSSNTILRPYIRVSVFATINTLKRTLACYFRGDISHYNDYDIFCNDELMGRDFSMMFIMKTRWRDHSPDEPIRLAYKLHKEF